MDIKPENPDEDNKLNSCDHHIEKCKRYVFHMVFQRAGQFVTSVHFTASHPMVKPAFSDPTLIGTSNNVTSL